MHTVVKDMQDGSHEPTIIADNEQLYSLQISNHCGSSFDALNVIFDDRIPVIDIDPVIELCEGEMITLDATQNFEAAYLWGTGSSNASIQVNTPGIYAINVYTECASIHHEIQIINSKGCQQDIYIPTVFSPNGDHVNDAWSISPNQDLDIISMQCSIFDRWGNMVFDTEDMPVVWDGSFDGKSSIPGVYTFRAIIVYQNGGSKRSFITHGDITLIR